MPTLMAGLLGSVVGGVLQEMLRPYLGVPLSALLGLIAFFGLFFPVRNWLRELRGD